MGDAVRARDLVGCRHRFRLEQRARAVDGEPVVGVGAELRIDAARRHRERLRDVLAAGASGEGAQGWRDVAGLGPDATLAACRAGVGRLWAAQLPTFAGRTGAADLLVRVGERYVPVIVVNHRAGDPGEGALVSPLHVFEPATSEARRARGDQRDVMRLAHLWRMLDAAGLAEPTPRGGVIGSEGDHIVVLDLTADLAAYDQRLADRLAVLAGEATTEVQRVSECRGCPFWSGCEADLIARRDVSIVARPEQARTLAESGVRTVDQLAALTDVDAKLADAVALARAFVAGYPAVRKKADVAVRRADVEVDVDMESYGEDGAYLWGTLITDTTNPRRKPEYRPFVTWRPLPDEDEARSFASFWHWLMGVRRDARAKERTFAAYCYSQHAENRWLLGSADRFAGRPGVPTREEVAAFIASDEWVDVFESVRDGFLSIDGKGLKKFAPLAGFTWRDAEAGGEASMAWYRQASGMAGTPDESQRRRILHYNEDDVRATKALREWLSGPVADVIPLATDLRG